MMTSPALFGNACLLTGPVAVRRSPYATPVPEFPRGFWYDGVPGEACRCSLRRIVNRLRRSSAGSFAETAGGQQGEVTGNARQSQPRRDLRCRGSDRARSARGHTLTAQRTTDSVLEPMLAPEFPLDAGEVRQCQPPQATIQRQGQRRCRALSRRQQTAAGLCPNTDRWQNRLFPAVRRGISFGDHPKLAVEPRPERPLQQAAGQNQPGHQCAACDRTVLRKHSQSLSGGKASQSLHRRNVFRVSELVQESGGRPGERSEPEPDSQSPLQKASEIYTRHGVQAR